MHAQFIDAYYRLLIVAAGRDGGDPRVPVTLQIFSRYTELIPR